MSSFKDCPYCADSKKKQIGVKFKICAYCMRPVTSKNVPANGNELATESVSILTTSGVIALSVFGLELSFFNSLLLGLLSAFFITGLSKALLLGLKALGLILIFIYTANKLVDFSLYFIEQVIIFFELRQNFTLKDGLAAAFVLFFYKFKY